MSCVRPLIAVDKGLDSNGKHQIQFVGMKHRDWDLIAFRRHYGKSLMMLPCGQCVACAQDYARSWQCRIMCEAQYHEKTCFLTLTYGKNPPFNPSKEHLRKFIKDVRNKYGKGIKFFGCGEKGEQNDRSHYHLILFGVDFCSDPFARSGMYRLGYSKELEDLWQYGFCTVGALDIASAGYVSKYCDKKKITRLNNGEFVIMSRGLGKRYFQEHYKEIFQSDFLYFKGNKFKIPRYFLKMALSSDDFYLRCLADDYSDRKRLVAQSFRFNSGMSTCEDYAVYYKRNQLENEKRNKEKIRNV